MTKYKDQFRVVEAIVRGHGHNPVAIFLQGSQNYNLDVDDENYQSDIDMKVFIIPSLDDLYDKKEISKTYRTPYGLVEVKDIRLLVSLLNKANPSYLELLATDHFVWSDQRILDIVDLLPSLFEERKQQFIYAMGGTAMQKYKGMFKTTEMHQAEFEKYGYVAKEYHHLLRIATIVKNVFVLGMSFKESIRFKDDSSERKLLIDAKTTHSDLKTVTEIADHHLKYIDDVLNAAKDHAEFVESPSLNAISKIIKQIVFDNLEV